MVKYKLSICAIAKNEHFGLEEWICYHSLVGVEHIYIYDNESVIPVHETLDKYIATGYVTCIEFPGLSKQMPAYDHCLSNFGKDNQWLAIIDCDEFLLPKNSDYVPDILDQFSNYGALQVNWILFGSNGHIQRPPGLVIENYTKASNDDWKENLHTKSIVQPRFTRKAGNNPHHCIYHPGFCAVGENFEGVPNAWSRSHNVEKIQLNHYTCKSLEDFQMKLAKGRADAAHLPTKGIEHIKEIDQYCQTNNFEILRFADRTKKLLHG